MLRGYTDVKTLCPFYLADNSVANKTQSIECESLFVKCKNVSIFENKASKLKHKEKYCNCMNYKKCPAYCKLMEKYDME